MPTVIELVDSVATGDPSAAADLLPLVYDELRKLAAARMAIEPRGHTLQPTALVHEAYLRLIGPKDPAKWDHRGHFFAAAARAMRRVLVDHARARDRNKRGGDWRRVELNPGHRATHQDPARELILDEAISRLAAEDSAAAGVAALHLFADMSIGDVAQCTGVSRTTAYEQWTYARAWLGAALGDQDGAAAR